MGLSQIVATVSAFVTGLVQMSCHHAPPPKPVVPPTSATAAVLSQTNSVNSKVRDLGEISLTNHYERCVQLGGGKECILYPKLVGKNNAEITVTFESKTSTGQIHDMIISQVDAKSGEPIEVMLGDFQLNLKPVITSE